MAAGSKKIVLWFPTPIDEWDHRLELPLSIMAVAAPLELKGYQCVLIDERLNDNPYETLVKECQDALCLGISSMTGYQLVGAVKAGKLIKETYPNLPIIWGGLSRFLAAGGNRGESLCGPGGQGPGRNNL